MTDRQRLLRLQRLARVRAIAREDAARCVAEAEGTLAQLKALVDRTGALTTVYDSMPADQDAARLQAALRFRTGLLAIKAQAMVDHDRTRTSADDLQLALAQAERRRALVQDRAEALGQAIAQAQNLAPQPSARRFGTELDK